MTVSANKMAMGLGITVKSFWSIVYRNLCNFSKLYKKRKVTIHSSQTNIGKFFFHFPVNTVCGRMFFAASYVFPNVFPLSAVF